MIILFKFFTCKISEGFDSNSSIFPIILPKSTKDIPRNQELSSYLLDLSSVGFTLKNDIPYLSCQILTAITPKIFEKFSSYFHQIKRFAIVYGTTTTYHTTKKMCGTTNHKIFFPNVWYLPHTTVSFFVVCGIYHTPNFVCGTTNHSFFMVPCPCLNLVA